MAVRNNEDLVRGLGEKLLGSVLQVIEKTISSAQLLASFTTPIALMDTPGANKIWVPEFFVLEKPAGTAYTVVSLTDVKIGWGPALAGGVAAIIDEAGFLDSTALESRLAYPRATVGGAVNADLSLISATGPVNKRNLALYITCSGANPAAGTGGLKVMSYVRQLAVNNTFSW